MAIKLVIFDIGGVLVDFMEEWYIKYLHEVSMRKIPARELEKFIMPLIVLMEYGTLNVPELERMVGKHFGIANLDMHWVKGWKKLARPKKDVIALVNRLSEDYRVVLLSNISFSRGAEAKKLIGPMLKPRKIYRSCDLQMRKPGPSIYRYVLEAEKAKPSEALFVDNQIENVIGAEHEGINTIWFRDYAKLVADLRKFKVLE